MIAVKTKHTQEGYTSIKLLALGFQVIKQTYMYVTLNTRVAPNNTLTRGITSSSFWH